MPRPRKAERTVEVNVLLPMTLAAAMDILLWDAVLKKPKYGARSALITQLITDWVRSQMPDYLTRTEVPDSDVPSSDSIPDL